MNGTSSPFQIWGGEGFDTYTRSEAGQKGLPVQSSISSGYPADVSSFSGSGFGGFESLNLTFSDDDNWVLFDASPLAFGATVNLAGGVGTDKLTADFAALANTTFVVAANGTVTSNRGTFQTFEQYELTLGGGTNTVTTWNYNDIIIGGAGNDTLTGGAGNDVLYGNGGTNTLNGGNDDDQLYSTGGVDTVNGGSGIDSWVGDYSASATNLAFSFNRTTGAGSLTGGTTLAGIEALTLTTGSGNDSVTISGIFPSSTFYGGSGIDTYTFSYAGQRGQPFISSNIYYDNVGGFSGYIDGGYGGSFANYENLNFTFSDDSNTVYFDASPLAFGATLVLAGGVGFDTLIADLSTLGSTTFTVATNGTLTENIAGATFQTFEIYYLTLGGGTNVVTTGAYGDTIIGGAGNDTLAGGAGADTLYGNGGTNTLSGGNDDDRLYSTGGIDTVDGGSGVDLWIGDYSASTANLTFTYNGTTDAGSLTGGTTLVGIETFILNTGSGNDSVTLNGTGASGIITGGEGVDTYVRNQTGETGLPSLQSSIYADGIGGFSGDFNGGYGGNFNNYENLNFTFSDDDNSVYFDASPLALGATATLAGGIGTDTLRADLRTLGNTTFTVAANGALTENIAGATFLTFEAYNLTLGNGTNVVTTGAYSDTVYGGTGVDTLTGGAGNDWLYGFAGNDLLSGGLGDDYMEGGTETDTVSFASASGAVTIQTNYYGNGYGISSGAAGNDTFFDIENYIGSAFDDVFFADNYYASDNDFNGGAGRDTLSYAGALSAVTVTLSVGTGTATGGAGSDTLTSIERVIGSAFNDSLTGESNANTLEGGGGNDTLNGAAGDDTLLGGSGNDKLNGGTGADGMSGGTGDDTYIVDNVGDTVIELVGEGIDTVTSTVTFTLGANVENLALSGTAAIDGNGNEEANIITGAAGNNVLRGFDGNDTLTGNAGNDTLYGGAGSDLLNGGSGIDTASYSDATAGVTLRLTLLTAQVTGGSGTDTVKGIENLIGSNFADDLTGDAGINVIDGSDGNDMLAGNGGNDTLLGGTGNDTLNGGSGADGMSGGLGDDTYSVDDAGDTVVEAAGEGTDTVNASISYALGANVENLTLTGSSAIDGTGNALANVLNGGTGNNVLLGLAGDDVLRGYAGNDTLNGGTGINTLAGGSGSDIFVFDVLETSAQRDIITDFAAGSDTIALSQSAFTTFLGSATGAMDSAAFRLGTSAVTADQRIIYNAATGALYYDVDGAGGQAQVQIASLGTKPVIDASAFMIIL